MLLLFRDTRFFELFHQKIHYLASLPDKDPTHSWQTANKNQFNEYMHPIIIKIVFTKVRQLPFYGFASKVQGDFAGHFMNMKI